MMCGSVFSSLFKRTFIFFKDFGYGEALTINVCGFPFYFLLQEVPRVVFCSRALHMTLGHVR